MNAINVLLKDTNTAKVKDVRTGKRYNSLEFKSKLVQ